MTLTVMRQPLLSLQPGDVSSASLLLCPSAAVPTAYSGIVPLSLVERVIPDVRVVILQCLTACHKLAVITRLSRAFHPLPCQAFRHDSTAELMLPDIVTAETRRMPSRAQLQALSVTVQQAEEEGATLFTCPRSLLFIPHLSTLEELHICMGLPEQGVCTASLHCILRSVLTLPALQRLRIEGMSEQLWRDWQTWVSSIPPPDLAWTNCSLPDRLPSARSRCREWRSLPPQSSSSARCLCTR
jgi:hypothetical protein